MQVVLIELLTTRNTLLIAKNVIWGLMDLTLLGHTQVQINSYLGKIMPGLLEDE